VSFSFLRSKLYHNAGRLSRLRRIYSRKFHRSVTSQAHTLTCQASMAWQTISEEKCQIEPSNS